MFTRQHKHQQQQKEIEKLCTPFSIDITIQYPPIIKELQHTTQLLKIEQKKVQILEHSIRSRLKVQIMKRICNYHPYGDVQVEIDGMPQYMWRKISALWEPYVPQRKKPYFDYYKKITSGKLFQETFPEVNMVKIVTGDVSMKITISSRAPSRMAYSIKQEKLILTFWYEPFPWIEGWTPKYRGDGQAMGKCKQKCYWQDKKK